MKLFRVRSFLKRPLPAALFSLFLVGVNPFVKAEVYSPVFGFLKFDCLAGSDTIASVPFHPAPRWAGRLLTAPAAQGDKVRLSLKDTPAFAAGELTGTPHYLFCRDAAGPTGRHFTIVAHGSDTLDIDATLAEFAGLTVDGLVSVVPAWTLASLFPPDTQTTFHASAGPLASNRGSELLFFDSATVGTSLAPSRRFFVTNTAWFEVGSPAAAGNVAFVPGQAFIVRHRSGDEVEDTEFVANQQVYGGPVSLAIPVSVDRARDTMLAPPRPVTITLAELDLGGHFVASATTAQGDRKDEILVFDNVESAMNKAPSAIYYRLTAGQWREVISDSVVDPALVDIEPSAGLLLRKAAAGTDIPLRWANAPTYDVTAP